MSIPTSKQIMLPLLECLQDGKERHVSDITRGLAKQLHLTDSEAKQLKPSSSHETMFHNRVGWALYAAKKAGLVSSTRHGFRKITDGGLAALSDGPKQPSRKAQAK